MPSYYKLHEDRLKPIFTKLLLLPDSEHKFKIAQKEFGITYEEWMSLAGMLAVHKRKYPKNLITLL